MGASPKRRISCRCGASPGKLDRQRVGEMEHARRVSHHHTTGAEALRYTASRAPHQCHPVAGFAELRGTCRSLSGKPSRRVGDDLTGQQKHHQHWLVTDLCVGGNMANQSASPLVQQPQSGDELQGRGCPSRLAGPQTRGSQRGEKTRPVSDRAIGHPLEQGHRAIMQSRRIGWAASQRGPQGSSSRPRLWRSRPCQRLPSPCALFASSSNNSLVGALCRWHRHAVPRDLGRYRSVALPSES